MAVATASDLTPLDVSGNNSPRSRVGRGLESIGTMTADTFHRLTTAVGGVAKSPVILMAKVGSLGSPRAIALPSPPSLSLEDRVLQLEVQMKSLEEMFHSRDLMTDSNPSPSSYKEKPRIAKSLLQEMETDGTLVKRVQVLEDRLNERMGRLEKTISSIQSQLAHIDFSKSESVTGFERLESPSGEPQYYDAEQHNDNFEALEVVEPKYFEETGVRAFVVLGEVTGASPKFGITPVKKASVDAPSTAENLDPAQEVQPGKSRFVSLKPPLASTILESKEASVTEPTEAALPSAGFAEPVEELNAGKSGGGSLEPQLASTFVESTGAFVKEPMDADAPSAEPVESELGHDAGKSGDISSGPQDASTSVEPKEATVRELKEADSPRAGSSEPVEELNAGKGGGVSLDPQFVSGSVESREAFVKGPMEGAAPSSESEISARELGPGKMSDFSLKPQLASTSVESKEAFVKDPMEASAPRNEPVQSERGHDAGKSDVYSEPPVASASVESKVASVREPMEAAESTGEHFEPVQKIDSEKSGDGWEPPVVTSIEPSEASVRQPLEAADSTAEHVEPVQKIDSENTGVGWESQVAPTWVDSREAVVTQPIAAAAPNGKLADSSVLRNDACKLPGSSDRELSSTAEELDDAHVAEPSATDTSAELVERARMDPAEKSSVPLAPSETQSAFVLDDTEEAIIEEPLTAIPVSKSEKLDQEEGTHSTGSAIAAADSSSPHTFDAPQEFSVKDSLAAAPIADPAQEVESREVSDSSLASSEPPVASKFVKEPLPNFEDSAHEGVAEKADTTIAANEAPLASSFKEPKEMSLQESVAAAPSAEHAQELARLEGSDMALAISDPEGTCKFVKEPSARVPSAHFGKPALEDAAESPSSNVAAAEVLSPEESVKETPSAAPGACFEDPALEDAAEKPSSNVAATELLVSSLEKSVKEPFAASPSAHFEEPALEDTADKTRSNVAAAPSAHFVEPALEGTAEKTRPNVAATETPLASSSEEPREESAKEPSAAAPSAHVEEPALEDAAEKTSSNVAAASSVHLGEPALEDTVEKTSSNAAATEAPLVSSLEKSVNESPSGAPSAHFEEPSLENTAEKARTDVAATEAPLASSLEETLEQSVKQPMADAPSAHLEEPALEDTVEKTSSNAAATEAPLVSSLEKSVNESPSAAPSAHFEEPALEDAAEKARTDVAATEAPLISSLEKSVNEPPSDARSAHFEEPALEGTAEKTSSNVAATEVPLASSLEEPRQESAKEPSAAAPSAHFEEPALEGTAEKTRTSVAATEAPLASSLEETLEQSVKQPTADAPSAESARENGDMAHANSGCRGAPKFLEAASATTSSANFSERAYETVDTEIAPLASSLDGPQEHFGKEPLAVAPSAEPAQKLATREDSGVALAHSEPQVTSAFVEEPSAAAVLTAGFGGDTVDKSGTLSAGVGSSLEEPRDNYAKESSATSSVLERAEVEDSEKSASDFAPLKAQSASNLEEHREAALFKGPSGTSVQNEEPTQEERGVVVPSAESTGECQNNPVEVGNHLPNEAEYKFAEDLKVPHEHAKSVGAAEDSDDRLESDQSGEEFFDAEHGSGHFDPRDYVEPNPFEDAHVSLDEPGDSTGINPVAQKLTLVPAQEPALECGQEPARELEKSPAQEPAQEFAQEHEQALAGERSLEPERAEQPALEHAQQPVQEQGLQPARPIQEQEQQPARAHEQNAHGQQLAREQGQDLTQEHEQDPVQQLPAQELEQPPTPSTNFEEPVKANAAAEDLEHQPPAQELEQQPAPSTKFDEPAKANTAAEDPAQELEQPPTPSTKFEEPVKANADAEDPEQRLSGRELEPPPTPSTKFEEPAKANAAAEDPEQLPAQELEQPLTPSTKFEEFAKANASAEDPKKQQPAEELEVRRTPSTKFDESAKANAALEETGLRDVPLPSSVEEPQMGSAEKSLSAEGRKSGNSETLTATDYGFGKSDNAHISLQSLLASTSEESKETLVNESVKTVPSSDTIEPAQGGGDTHSGAMVAHSAGPQLSSVLQEPQEDFADTQCLPFRLLGEGKQPRKESVESKVVEDVKDPVPRSEGASSYVLEPRPSRIKVLKEKKKKVAKEKKPEPSAVPERRHSFELGWIERKGSLRGDEKASKLSPRSEEKHKLPFKHFRERLRHAFSVNKDQ